MHLVQILMSVVIIQMRTLKAEVKKVFMRTAIGHELIGPKSLRKFFINVIYHDDERDLV